MLFPSPNRSGRWTRSIGLRLALLPALLAGGLCLAAIQVVQTYDAPGSVDQDDMSFWVHPGDPSASLLIGSDKASGNVYVYELDGTLLQTVPASMPGNIAVRQGFQLGGRCADVVVFNDRIEEILRVYTVDRVTRELVRVDDGAIITGPNYGLGLYRHTDGALYAVTGPRDAPVVLRQFRLFDNGTGQVSGTPTGWQFATTITEGMVGDDETGYYYLGEENVGIWRVHWSDDTDRTLIAQVGDASGLAADVEGLTLYHASAETGYLIASSQGANKYTVLERQPPHAPVGEFQVTGVGGTDGIDLLDMNLGGSFEDGIFAFHNDAACCPIQAVRIADIEAEVPTLDFGARYRDPRGRCGPFLDVGSNALSWTEAAGAGGYDVVRGDLESLRLGGGDYQAATLECLADDAAALTLPHASAPGSGDAWWFLIRAVSATASDTYDSLYDSQTGLRDPEVDAARVSCP